MKDRFAEYYSPSDEDLRRFTLEATVVPDANVLLGLYQLSTSERAEVLGALNAVRERLWLPYQAGLEYQRNRMRVIRRQAADYHRMQSIHGARSLEGMQEFLSQLSLPPDVLAEISNLLPLAADRLSEALRDFEEDAALIMSRHVVSVEEGLTRDPVRARLDDLFTGRVGAKPTDEVHAARIKDGLRRFADKIPPGFKDANKETDEQKVGDYLLWAQLLDFAAELAETGDSRAILFVTADEKADWFERSGGEAIGPLPALTAEFKTRSDGGYHQVTLSGFLSLANEHLKTSIGEETIERASTVKSVDQLRADAGKKWQQLAEMNSDAWDLERFQRQIMLNRDSSALERLQREAVLNLGSSALERLQREAVLNLDSSALERLQREAVLNLDSSALERLQRQVANFGLNDLDRLREALPSPSPNAEDEDRPEVEGDSDDK